MIIKRSIQFLAFWPLTLTMAHASSTVSVTYNGVIDSVYFYASPWLNASPQIFAGQPYSYGFSFDPASLIESGSGTYQPTVGSVFSAAAPSCTLDLTMPGHVGCAGGGTSFGNITLSINSDGTLNTQGSSGGAAYMYEYYQFSGTNFTAYWGDSGRGADLTTAITGHTTSVHYSNPSLVLVTPVPSVPEPAQWMLSLAGLLALIPAIRRKSNGNASLEPEQLKHLRG